MKRGNTALKRVVSVTSVAAMAIAGAVLAAPAANAWDTGAGAIVTGGVVRATPATDAAYIGGKYVFGQTYTSGNPGTGQVQAVAIGKTSQSASGLQAFLPVNTSHGAAWQSGDEVTVSLPTDYKFSTSPTVSLQAKAVNTGVSNANVQALAGFDSGSTAHALPAGGGELASAVVTVTGAGTNILHIALPAPTQKPGTTPVATDAYLLSISNVTIDVAATHAAVQGESVVATFAGTDQDGAGTTNWAWAPSAATAAIAYVNNLAITTVGDPTTSGTTVTLPATVVSELVKDGFAPGAGATVFSVRVTGTPTAGNELQVIAPSPATTIAAPSSVKVNSTVSLSATGGSTADNTFTVSTVTGTGSTSNTTVESVGVSGLQVKNVKPGTDVTLTIVAPVSGSAVGTTPAQTGAGSAVVKTSEAASPRFAGSNRYATAAKIAAARTWGGSAVVIANGTDAKNGADALSANFLAGVLNAPLLLTSADTLAADTEQALKDLFKNSSAAVTVYYMGKTDSISQAVRDKVEATIKGAQSVVGTVTAKKIEGNDRYATAAEAAKAVDINDIKSYNLGKGTLRTAFLASGQVNADALAAGALSAGSQIPVLLTTDADALPKATSDTIGALHLTQIIVLGGTDRVSQKVEDDLKSAGVNVIRLAGVDRFDTATKIAAIGLGVQPDGVRTATPTGDSVSLYLANGTSGWADALAAGPYVGKTGGALITIGSATSFTTATSLFLANNKGALGDAQGLGGTDRVTDAQIVAASALAK